MEGGEGAPQKEQKTFNVEGDLFDREKISKTATNVAKRLLDALSNLSEEEKAKRLSGFSNKILNIGQGEPLGSVKINNDHDITIMFGEPAFYYNPLENRGDAKLHAEGLNHNADGILVDVSGRPIFGQEYIHNEPRLEILFFPKGEASENLDRFKKAQESVLSGLVSEGFGGNIYIGGAEKNSEEMGAKEVAFIEFGSREFGRGRGNVMIATNLRDYPVA